MKASLPWLFLLGTTATAVAAGQKSEPLYWWVQPASNAYSVRAILSGLDAPCGALDAPTGVVMTARHNPAPDNLPVTVCEANLPASTSIVALHDTRMRFFPARSPERVVVIGDTGCRVKELSNDPEEENKG